MGSSKSFKEAVKEATGKNLSSKAIIREINLPPEQVIARAKKRIAALAKKRVATKPIDLKATITMVHGNEKIADNKKSFEKMAKVYSKWVIKQTS